MLTLDLINEVKKIILRHTQPERIWVFGSRVLGEEQAGSDLDIAFDAPNADYQTLALIEEEVQALETIIKIEVKNIALADAMFANRVRDTGVVIYSAHSKQRFEDSLNNFRSAFEQFTNALSMEKTLIEKGLGDIVPDVLIKRFEFTFELGWKTIRRWLDYQGVASVTAPREVLRSAYTHRLVREEDEWCPY